MATLLHHPSPFAETSLTVDASDIWHIKGEQNVVADTLSRPEISAVDVPAGNY